ncbi:MAG TPA: endonuclease domain-containing protein [Rhodanobacteraceae bacterium]
MLLNPSPLMGEGQGRGWPEMPKRLEFARTLRQAMTDAERALWYQLRAKRLLGWKFRRQQLIGTYIVDFVCFEAKLVVELDGSQHAEQVDADARRTAWLESQGFRVLRFWNDAVLKEMGPVLAEILRNLPLSPTPLPQGERG